MNNIYILLIYIICSNAYSAQAQEEIIINKNSSIKFSTWNQETKAWGNIIFETRDQKFNIYSPLGLPGQNTSKTTVSSNEKLLSENGRLLLVERIISTELYDESGNPQPSERMYCDILDTATGCVLSSHTGGFCAGSWSNNKWENASGQPIGSNLETSAPKDVIEALLRSDSDDVKINEISNFLYMGVESYLACHPPTNSNIQQLNDIGFFIYTLGSSNNAMLIYKAVEGISPNRIVLKLNIADTLWELNDHEKAINYYNKYIELMSKHDKSKKIPTRALVRARAKTN